MTEQSSVAPFINVSSNNNKVVISFKNISQQIFDFPYDVIKHILAKANYKVVTKLYFICKYFPAKYRLYLVDDFNGLEFVFKNSRKKFPEGLLHLDRLWLGISYKNLFISDLAPKLEKCTIKILNCSSNLLSWNDYKTLAEARTIEELQIDNILDTDGQKVPIEDICDYTPNLNCFYSHLTHVTPNSIQKICKSLISTKMWYFCMYSVDGLLNTEDYFEFIKIHPKTYFAVTFDFEISKDQVRLFYTVVLSEIKKWPKPKPSFN